MKSTASQTRLESQAAPRPGAEEPVIATERALRDARAAGQRGEWDRVVTLLDPLVLEDREQRLTAAFLFARATLHADQPGRALAALDSIAAVCDTRDDRATAMVLRGAALIALGRADEGVSLLSNVAGSRPNGSRIEALYELATAFASMRRVDQAAAALDTLLDGAVQSVPAAVRARALEAYGWIEIRRYRRPIAARHFRDALDTLTRSNHDDPALRAALLHALATVAVDTLDLRLLADVRGAIGSTDWTALLGGQRAFAVRRTLAVGEALDGNLTAAWQIADALRADVPAGMQRISADLTAATVAQAAGETFTPERLVGKGLVAANDVDWAGADQASGQTLLALIRHAAWTDLAAAQRLLSLYETLPQTQGPALHEDHSSTEALEHLARAAVAAHAGQRKEQVDHLHFAVAAWRTVQHAHGELQALLMLVDSEPAPEALERADELSRLVPRSWLRRRYEFLVARARGPEQLSPAERRVMLAVAQGLSTAEIATLFARSKNTIRNQTRRVFEVFGVRTRSALAAKCANMGLLTADGPERRSEPWSAATPGR